MVVVVVGTCAKVSAQALWFSWASRVNRGGPCAVCRVDAAWPQVAQIHAHDRAAAGHPVRVRPAAARRRRRPMLS